MGHVTAARARIIKRGDIGTVRTVAASTRRAGSRTRASGAASGARGAATKIRRHDCLGDIGTHREHRRHDDRAQDPARAAKMDKVSGRLLDDNDRARRVRKRRPACTGRQIAIGHDNSLRVRIYGDGGSIQWFQEAGRYRRQGRVADRAPPRLRLVAPAAASTQAPERPPERLDRGDGEPLPASSSASARRRQAFAETVDFPTVSDGADGVRSSGVPVHETATWVEL